MVRDNLRKTAMLLSIIAGSGCNSTETGASAAKPLATSTYSDSAELQETGNCRVLVHDAGTLAPGDSRRLEYEVSNPSATSWTVKSVSTNCSCTAAVPASNEIEPRSRGKFYLEYRASGRTRNDSRAVMVSFNEADAPTVVLKVNAAIREVITVVPESLAIQAPPNQRIVEHFQLLNYGKETWENLSVASPVDWITANVTTASDEPGRDKHAQRALEARNVQLTIDTAGMSLGDYNVKLLISAVGKEQSLPLVLSLRGPVALIPSRLFFGPISLGVATEKEFTIRLTRDGLCLDQSQLRASENLIDQLVLTVVENTHSYIRVKAILTPAQVGVLKGNIEFAFNAEDMPKIDLPVFASVQ